LARETICHIAGVVPRESLEQRWPLGEEKQSSGEGIDGKKELDEHHFAVFRGRKKGKRSGRKKTTGRPVNKRSSCRRNASDREASGGKDPNRIVESWQYRTA